MQYFGNKPQQGPNPNVPSQHGGLQSDVSAPHGADGGYAPGSAPQAFVNQQARGLISRVPWKAPRNALIASPRDVISSSAQQQLASN